MEPEFWQEWKCIGVLGVGAYAEVWKVQNIDSQKLASLKIYKADCWNSTLHYLPSERSTRLKQEHRAYRLVQKLAIVELCELITVQHPRNKQNAHWALLLDYHPGVDVCDWAMGCTTKLTQFLSDPAQVWRLILCCCQELNRLHCQGITHGDIKPDNLLICFDESERFIRTIDFGSCQPSREPLRSEHIGTIGYCAPEWLPHTKSEIQPLAQSMDVFALGSTLYNVMSGRWPYEVMNGEVNWENLSDDFYPPDPDIQSLVREMLARDPAKRPSIPQIIRRIECR